MKLLIAADMEGITGVVHWDHVSNSHPEYRRFRRMMTADINAAIRGACAAGVEDIVVADGHGSKTNILIEELDPRARLNTGSASLGMVQGIDGGVDAVFFIGYHARAGTPSATLAHTVSGAKIANVWLNQRLVGETGINTAVCAHFGAPVLLVSGDASVCQEAAETLPGVHTAITKIASGFSSAEALPPDVTHPRIESAAQAAILDFHAGKFPAVKVEKSPVQMVVEYKNAAQADRAARLPGAQRMDGTKVGLSAPDMPQAYRCFRATVSLAGD